MMIREMTHNECVATIACQRLARLACAENNSAYVVRICYAYSANRFLAFSMPGKKLNILRTNPKACLLIDALESRHRWKASSWTRCLMTFPIQTNCTTSV